jgi:hypothetical protein
MISSHKTSDSWGRMAGLLLGDHASSRPVLATHLTSMISCLTARLTF